MFLNKNDTFWHFSLHKICTCKIKAVPLWHFWVNKSRMLFILDIETQNDIQQ